MRVFESENAVVKFHNAFIIPYFRYRCTSWGQRLECGEWVGGNSVSVCVVICAKEGGMVVLCLLENFIRQTPLRHTRSSSRLLIGNRKLHKTNT